jgi:hypothetical protein
MEDVEAPWVSPVEVKNPNEVTPFPRDRRRLYLVKRGDLDDRRDALLGTMVSLSELPEPWRQMADSALQDLVGEAVKKLLTDKVLVLPEGKGRGDVVVTIKHDKTRVPLRPIESWYVNNPTSDREVRVDGYGERPAARAFSHHRPHHPPHVAKPPA